ncbi:CHAT domain-containing protein [Actinokineospora iranica]|uniref:CHAT domain-containing protein n=1 Tax=Actinokineospora iranica TaxID=1271860 RepID=A0A1G6VRD1_9PSEU|nr:CHAT domain-containing protein [Actinokineospora iranica]SDD55415.1 CHAT domain-containing protein [Actinokineospora iranica]
MSFDDLTRQVRWRLDAYRETREAGAVMDEAALAEADRLWRAARTRSTGRPESEDRRRLAVAHHALGWLFFLRTVATPPRPGRLWDLARAVVFCAPLADDPGAIPAPLHALIGPDADIDQQTALAFDLVEDAAADTDVMLAEAAIVLLATAVPATPEGHPSRAWHLHVLGRAHLRRFQGTGAEKDLDRAISVGRRALEAAPAGSPIQAGCLAHLGRACLVRFERAGAMTDLDLAAELTERALNATSADDPYLATLLSNLGLAHLRRFERLETAADLNRAIELGEQVLDATPSGHSDLALRLGYLGRSYLTRFQRIGGKEDLDRSISLTQQALDATPGGDQYRNSLLFNLRAAHWKRFEYFGAVADVDQVIELGEQTLATADRPDQPTLLSGLSTAYLRRFDLDGAMADVERAIELGEEALNLGPADDPGQAALLSDLGLAHLRRFERLGRVADVDRAVELIEQALATTRADHPERTRCLANLGLVRMRRFDRLGTAADLDRAIEVRGQLVDAVDPDHPYRAIHLADLSTAYGERFERVGAVADLERAIELGEEALDATPEDHPERASLRANLGGRHLARFEHLGAAQDLDRAIELTEQALELIPAGHPDQPGPLINLATARLRRFRRLGAAEDLERAIGLGEQALDTTPADRPERALFMANLGGPYLARFERTGTMADLERAIELTEQALELIPADHPRSAMFLSNLGTAYLRRFQRSGHDVSGTTLRALADHVVSATTAPPAQRLKAAQSLGQLAYAQGEQATAVELFDAAVAMLPLSTPREGTWTDQEHILGQRSGLVGDAVAAHCALNDLTGAVDAAESGRGVLLAAQMDARTDLSDLNDADPGLGRQFQQIRDQLNAPAGSGRAADAIKEIETRKRLWAEHDELLAQIRQRPGFERFQRPPRLADLQPATAGGAVVMVNAGGLRSDAIIITSDAEPTGIPLPGLDPEEVWVRAREMLIAAHDSRLLSGTLRRRRVVADILGWLWDAIVEPVLDALPAADDTDEPLRVWWLPIGLLGLFPFHAAGHSGQPDALDKVVSSYTPTLRALANTRARPAASTRRQLTVALTRTPNLPDLPGTAAEAAALHAMHPDTPALADEEATTARVRSVLPTATWAHFACHAHADLATPSRGGLCLHDDTLLLPDIIRMRLADADLAYLSACSTAQGGWDHADESLHIASAFQMAGFRHVIASLWPLHDHIAATAASAFYHRLPTPPAADQPAHALRHVTLDLRAEHPDRPDLWAALVHSGA